MLTLPTVHPLTENGNGHVASDRPLIFHESNRGYWETERRRMIALLLQLDTWYGWQTLEPDAKKRREYFERQNGV